MMKISTFLPVVLAALGAAPPPPGPLLTCTTDTLLKREGDRLTLAPDGERLVYRFGTADRNELRIVGDPAAGNIHYRLQDEGTGDQRFVAVQLRFSNGPYSYIVTYDRHARTPYPRTAGLIVARGTRTLKVRGCLQWTLDESAYDVGRLPTDSDRYRHEYF